MMLILIKYHLELKKGVSNVIIEDLGGWRGRNVTKSKESNKKEESNSNVGQNVSQTPVERDPYDLFDEDPFS